MVTDYDSWRDGEHVEVADVMRVMAGNTALARDTLVRLAALLPAQRQSNPIDCTLDGAIMTAPVNRDPVLVAKLEAIAGRVLA
jgi:5'-methylthioadenosine phosphorylase